MDLYEYQAKDLFAAHGVPVGPGQRVVTDAGAAAAAAAEFGVPVVIKAQVKTGGRGKAGGVKIADDRAGRARRRPRRSSGLDIKGHTVRRVLVTPASRDRRGVLLLLPARPRRTARSSRWRPPRAAWTSSSSPSSAPTRWPRSRSTRSTAWTWPRPRRSSRAARFPAAIADAGRRGGGQAVGDVRGRGRHAGRGEPARPRPAGQDRRAGRQGHARRQRRRSATRRTPSSWTPPPRTRSRRRRRPRTSTTSSWTARSASSATAPAS